MDRKAMDIVRGYVDRTLDKDEKEKAYGIFIVWKAKIIQNWKYLISTTLCDGMYYELTFNGDRNEWYLDVYNKVVNFTIEGD